jgi:methyltransferase (TIGR00027 family)
MTNPIAGSAPELRDVGDTAHWVAAYRAEESERPDALFVDPFARALAGERGLRLLDTIPRARRMAWPMVARTVVLDRYLREAVHDGVDLVINLAAGLDARPYRMPELPAALEWVEVDLPRMLAYKEAILASAQPRCRLRRIACDLADGTARRELLAGFADGGRRGLVLTEGLLVYLEPETVAALARELAAVASLRSWLCDLASPAVLRSMQRTWGRAVARAGAPFLFAPANGPEFFRPFGWHLEAVASSLHVAARLGRVPWWMRPFAWLPEPGTYSARRPWAGMCRLVRGPAAPAR